MILSTLDKSRKGGAYEQIPSLVLGQRWTPQLNSRNIFALFNGRDESEVVLDPKYLKDITQAQEPTQGQELSM